MKRITVFILVLMTWVAMGCAKTEDKITSISPPTAKSTNQSDHFMNQVQNAEQYWQLKKDADALFGQDKYDEAIVIYKQALEKFAYSRPEQAIVLDSIAQSYEKKGDLKKAADNYELASECTMNENRKISLKSKADSLRSTLHTIPHTGRSPEGKH